MLLDKTSLKTNGDDGPLSNLPDQGIIASPGSRSSLADIYGLKYLGSDSESESEETTLTKNRSGLSEGALRHFYKDADHVGYTILGKKVIKILNESTLQALLDKHHGNDQDKWRTVIDYANQREIKLSARDVQSIQRLNMGQFADSNFNPYDQDYSVVDYHYNDPDMPFNDSVSRAEFRTTSEFEEKKIERIARLIKAGLWIDPKVEIEMRKIQAEDADDEVFDLWKENNIKLNHRALPVIPALKEDLPGNEESYNPAEKDKNSETKYANSLRLVPAYKDFLEERYHRLIDLSSCERSFRMTLNVDRESLLPPLPPLETLRPFPTAVKFRMRGLTMFRLKGEAGDNEAHYQRVIAASKEKFSSVKAIDVSPDGNFMAIGDERGVASVIHLLAPDLPGVVIWRDSLSVAKESSAEETLISSIKFHPKEPILAICKGYKVFYVILPEMIGDNPIPMKQYKSKTITEGEAISKYWKLYKNTNLKSAFEILGLNEGGPAAITAHDPEANKQKGNHRSLFSIQMRLSKQDLIDLEQMGDEEREINERAGPRALVTSGSLYLPTRPGLSLSVTQRYVRHQ